MVFGKLVSVNKETTDKYGRSVGTVFIGVLDVNKNQVARGMAWVYRKYAHDTSLFQIEETAKQSKVGLWADPKPSPPWEYRHPSATVVASKGSCGTKRYCKQMSSCEEARQYLGCGVSSLDKDGDGTPCESLCVN